MSQKASNISAREPLAPKTPVNKRLRVNSSGDVVAKTPSSTSARKRGDSCIGTPGGTLLQIPASPCLKRLGFGTGQHKMLSARTTEPCKF